MMDTWLMWLRRNWGLIAAVLLSPILAGLLLLGLFLEMEEN